MHAQEAPLITQLTWSADSQRLAVGYANGVLVTDGRRVVWAAQTSDPVIGLLFSTDGTTLYGATAATDLYAWDIVTGETRAHITLSPVPPSVPATVAHFNQTSRYIKITMGAHWPEFNALLDKNLNYLETLDPFGYTSGLGFVGDDMVGYRIDFAAQTIRIERNRQLETIIMLEHPPDRLDNEVRFSSDGRYLVVQANHEAPVEVFDTVSGTRLASLSPSGRIFVGDCVAYQRSDGTLVFYNLTSHTQVEYATGERIYSENGNLHRDGQTFNLVRCADYTAVHTFDVSFDETQIDNFRIFGDGIVVITPRYPASNEIIIVDTARDHQVRVVVPYFSDIAYMEPNRLLLWSQEGTLTIDVETGAILTRFLHEGYLFTVRPDGMAYAYACRSRACFVIQHFDGTAQVITLPWSGIR